MAYYDGCIRWICDVAFPKEALPPRKLPGIQFLKNIYGDPVDVSKVRILTKSAYLAMKSKKGGS